ncbi:MAG: S-methyl-5-thioribose-1-phosphate isomerase [Bacteroidetes bacterium]|nr:MAG: S-methyl-5-thioribose-1-phosphate isomerase [Bacteroidota bacterium]
MNINGKPYRTIWTDPAEPGAVFIIDQRPLPHELRIVALRTLDEAVTAIRDMWVRGAPLIGATAAFGLYLASLEAQTQADPAACLAKASRRLAATRPTAVNLQWALDRMQAVLQPLPAGQWPARALAEAQAIADEDVQISYQIGQNGLPLIEAVARRKPDEPVHILTHCNAGWMATVDWGTATAPIYLAHQAGIPLHVWVDETRPRNQGARITAYELAAHGIPHTVIPDNTGGHLMQHGLVDMCIVGTDRTTRCGDVANKIGTYLKALAAHDNGVPFYVALPSTTIDWSLCDGRAEIPIEQREGSEVTHIQGWDEEAGRILPVRLTPANSPAANYAFDVTPARLVTQLITERGCCEASESGLLGLFPEKNSV